MELIALSGIALLTAILVSRAVGTAAIQWAVTEAYSGTKYEDKTEEVLKDLDQFIEKHKVTEQNIELLVAWVQRQRDVYVTFYRDIDLFLDRIWLLIRRKQIPGRMMMHYIWKGKQKIRMR